MSTKLAPDAITRCSVMTQEEVAREIQIAMQVSLARTRSGRMTVSQMLKENGLAPVSQKIAETMGHYVIFLRQPPMALHSTPPREV